MSLDFDIARRFLVIVDLLKKNTAVEQPKKVLDLGGYPGTFKSVYGHHFPNWKITTADRLKGDGDDFVHLSEDKLPFDDNEYQVSISSDVLEHVPADKREIFLQELARVTSEDVFICFPFSNPISKAIELQLAEAWKEQRGTEHPWLKEHIDFGLPRILDVLDLFNASGETNLYLGAKSEEWMRHQWWSLFHSTNDVFEEKWKEYNQFESEILRADPESEYELFDHELLQTPYYRSFIHLDLNKSKDEKRKSQNLTQGHFDKVYDQVSSRRLLNESSMFQLIMSLLSHDSGSSSPAEEINSRLEAALLEATKLNQEDKKSIFSFLKSGSSKP